jgi:hypothetical protein
MSSVRAYVSEQRAAATAAGTDPECVCSAEEPHRLSQHDEDGRCTVVGCACAPGCIHEGFVDRMTG